MTKPTINTNARPPTNATGKESSVLLGEEVSEVDQFGLFGLIPDLALNCDAVHCESGM